MVKNESIARMVMFLCFGTAILSLIVHWRTRIATEHLNQPISTRLANHTHNPQENHYLSGVYTNKAVEMGETALGASLPFSSPKFSAVNPPDDPQLTPNQTQVVVNLSDRRVYVYKSHEVMASYPIAVGKKGWETPTGDFQVMHMEQHPIWRHPITGKVFEPGSDSPLGDRWIGFWSDGRNEVGFHGTPNIDLVGTAVSHGCLRMRNSDVRLLYTQVNLGTPVTVRN